MTAFASGNAQKESRRETPLQLNEGVAMMIAPSIPIKALPKSNL